eukprot:TRINITY_DN7779_c0_g3_i1.p1 TRINITY_DN7779_c0_g3~~TRINITY_DN7779_c0_g3_i1.p1  ORF type:complete len:370 (-),score=64.09 TRINITY_DN7779_c0_g3_i1:24-980(-)
MGATYFTAPNPEFGAVFTYYLKEVPKTAKQIRKEKEKELDKAGKYIPQPSWKAMDDEAKEVAPYLVFVVKDAEGNEIRRLTTAAKKGINRINWDLRYQSLNPVKDTEFKPTKKPRSGMMIMPAKYQVEMGIVSKGKYELLADAVSFEALTLSNRSLPAKDREGLVAFQQKVAKMSRAIQGSMQLSNSYKSKISAIKMAILQTPRANETLSTMVNDLQMEVDAIDFLFNGVDARASGEEIPPAQIPISNRIGNIVGTHWASTSGVTQTQQEQFEILKEEFPTALQRLHKVAKEIKILESELEKLGAPWTPGRIPTYEVE